MSIHGHNLRCPHCHTLNHFDRLGGEFRCGNCHKTFGLWEATPEIETGRPIPEKRPQVTGSNPLSSWESTARDGGAIKWGGWGRNR